MRSISPTSLAKIAQTAGLEPINLIDVAWGGQSVIRYSDQRTPELQGKILELTDLEDVVNISGHNSTQSINIKLDDVDGSIKAIMDTIDIHKSDVKVYQWFKGIPLSDAFIVYQGQITTPIVWSEGDRTVTFSVVSKLEDMEVGFSAEEGDFEYIPPEIIGKAWPLTFGNPDKVPAVRIQKIPTGAIANLIGVRVQDVVSDRVKTIIHSNLAAYDRCIELAELYFILALEAFATASAYAFDQTVENINAQTIVDFGGTPRNFTNLIQQYNQIGNQYTDQGNAYWAQAQDIVKEGILSIEQVDDSPPESGLPTIQELERAQFQIANGFNFPQGSAVGVRIGDAYHTGQFDGTNFTVISRENPLQRLGIQGASPINVNDQPVSVKYEQDLSRQSVWIGQPGTLVVIADTYEYPINYIAALNTVGIRQVWAWRNLNGLRQLYPVPANYYSVVYQNFETIDATFITMIRPLSSYRDEGWEDEIFCDITSDVGSNVADVLQYLIEVWTQHQADPVSFDHVRAISGAYPMDFALLRRDNIIKVLQEIAFQARLAIWYSNGKFYLKYLPEVGTVVDTITDDDVEAGTMLVTCTDTENIVTKFTATWKPDGSADQFTAIFRHNILKYGTIEDSFDFYAYKYQQLVEKSSIFWMIRRANTWKILKFSTFLTKLNLETWDTVNLNLSRRYVCNGVVPAVVQSCKYNSSDNRIDLELWVPVRFGEMTEYPFALPAAIDETIIFPLPQDQAGGGGAGSGAKGTLFKQNPHVGNTRPHPTTGSNVHTDANVYVPQPSDLSDQAPQPSGTFVQPFVDPKITIGNQRTQTHRQWNIKDLGTINATNDVPGVFPGFVVTKLEDSNNYQVNVYLQGVDGDPSLVVARRLVDPQDDEPIEGGTPVFVNKNVWFENTGPEFDPQRQLRIEYTIDVTAASKASVFPGLVQGKVDDGTYNVNIFKKGLSGDFESVQVKQIGGGLPDDTIPKDTPVQVSSNTFLDPNTSESVTEYTMSVPVWEAEDPDE